MFAKWNMIRKGLMLGALVILALLIMAGIAYAQEPQSTPGEPRVVEGDLWPMAVTAVRKDVSPEGPVEPADILLYTLNIWGDEGTSVYITDDLPSEVDAVLGYDPRLTLNGKQLTGNFSLPGFGTALTIEVQLKSVLDTGISVTNWFTANTLTACVTNTIVSTPTLETSYKRINGKVTDTVMPSDPITYTVIMTNTGKMNAYTAYMTDTLPSRVQGGGYLNWTSGTARWADSNRVVTWTGGVSVGTPVTVTFVVTAHPILTNGLEITNVAEVGFVDGSRSEVKNTNVVTGVVQSVPDLTGSYKKVNDKDQKIAAPGEVITYTITLSNTGDMNTYDTARMTDTLPANVSYESGPICDGDCGYSPGAPGVITWTGQVRVGYPVIVTYAVRLDTPLDNGTKITNTATVTDGYGGPLPQIVPVTVTVVSTPNLGTSYKRVNGGWTNIAVPGEVFTYTAVLTNTGDMNATDGSQARFYDKMPDEMTVQNCQSSQGTPFCILSGSTVTWTGAVNVNEPVVITYRVEVKLPQDDGHWFTNTYTVTDGVHLWTSNPVTTTIASTPTLETSYKRVNGELETIVSPGNPLTYTVVLTNEGTMNAYNARMTDTLPSQVQGGGYLNWTSGTAGWADSNGVVTWTGGVSVGTPVTVTYRVTTNLALASGTRITNTATVDTGRGQVAETNEVTATVYAPGLSGSYKLVNSVTSITASPDDVVTYTTVLTNSGQWPAENAWMTDMLPTSVISQGVPDCSDGTCWYDGNEVVWEGSVPTNTQVMITYAVKIKKPLNNGTEIFNTASWYDGAGISGDTRGAMITIASSPYVTATKWINGRQPTDTVDFAGTVTYTVLMTNTGDMNAYDVVMIDIIPANTTYVSDTLKATYGSAQYVPGSSALAMDLAMELPEEVRPQQGSTFIYWGTEVMTVNVPVSVIFQVQLSSLLDEGDEVPNYATVSVPGIYGTIGGSFDTNEVRAIIGTVNRVYLPIILKNF